MGKRGPRPTPTPILKLRGSWRAKDRPDQTPATDKPPRCPSWIPERGRTEWRRITKILVNLGLYDARDLKLVEGYIMLYVKWRRLTEQIEELGGSPMCRKRGTGVMVEHPALRAQERTWTQLKQACAEFGGGPAARTGMMEIKTTTAKTGKDRFFGKKFDDSPGPYKPESPA